jgi:hypothetical protein
MCPPGFDKKITKSAKAAKKKINNSELGVLSALGGRNIRLGDGSDPKNLTAVDTSLLCRIYLRQMTDFSLVSQEFHHGS